MTRLLMKRYFITGLLIWIPLAITAWVLAMIVGIMDQSLLLLPRAIHPQTLLGFYLPGIGVVLTGVAMREVNCRTSTVGGPVGLNL